MIVLHVEHHVADYDAWKALFDSDPLDRRGSGVRRYRVGRSIDEPDLVTIDLELDDAESARRMLEGLRGLWAGPAREAIRDPKGQLLEVLDEQAP